MKPIEKRREEVKEQCTNRSLIFQIPGRQSHYIEDKYNLNNDNNNFMCMYAYMYECIYTHTFIYMLAKICIYKLGAIKWTPIIFWKQISNVCPLICLWLWTMTCVQLYNCVGVSLCNRGLPK